MHPNLHLEEHSPGLDLRRWYCELEQTIKLITPFIPKLTSRPDQTPSASTSLCEKQVHNHKSDTVPVPRVTSLHNY